MQVPLLARTVFLPCFSWFFAAQLHDLHKMYEPNPYKNNRLSIDETKPELGQSDGYNIECIEILPGNEDFEAKPDDKALNKIIRSIKEPEKVKAFVVDYNSGLRCLPDISAFKSLEYFHIAGRKIKAFDEIKTFKRLKNIFFASYKGDKIRLASGVGLEFFRAIKGSLQIIDFSSTKFFLQSCGKLERLGPIDSKVMWLEGCHALDLNSLGNANRLTHLRILGRKELKSLSFISKCEDLQQVSITATDMRRVDVGVLENSKSLKKIFLGQCSQPLLREFSESAPSVLLSNGDLTLIGAQVKEWSYFESV